MRLITHNMLKCNVAGVENGYPLIIESNVVENVDAEFNADMVKKILGRIDWNAFVAACKNIGLTELERLNIADAATFGDDILGEIHHALFEVHITDGFLVCPQSGRKFPIKDGIPNMLLHEDEV